MVRDRHLRRQPRLPCEEAHLPLCRVRRRRKWQVEEFAVAIDLNSGDVRQEMGEKFASNWLDVVRAFPEGLGD